MGEDAEAVLKKIAAKKMLIAVAVEYREITEAPWCLSGLKKDFVYVRPSFFRKNKNVEDSGVFQYDAKELLSIAGMQINYWVASAKVTKVNLGYTLTEDKFYKTTQGQKQLAWEKRCGCHDSELNRDNLQKILDRYNNLAAPPEM